MQPPLGQRGDCGERGPDARYPERKMPTGTSGRPAVCRRWFTVTKARIIGAAEGTIMATIITAHITKRTG